jgi:hypothetical protein
MDDLPLWTESNDDPLGPCPFRHLVVPEVEIRRGIVDGVDTVTLHWARRNIAVDFRAELLNGLSVSQINEQILQPLGRSLHKIAQEKRGAPAPDAA